jgi:hypothetical protein
LEEEKKKKEEIQREQLRKKMISEELSRSASSVTLNNALKKPKKSILDIINPASKFRLTQKTLLKPRGFLLKKLVLLKMTIFTLDYMIIIENSLMGINHQMKKLSSLTNATTI